MHRGVRGDDYESIAQIPKETLREFLSQPSRGRLEGLIASTAIPKMDNSQCLG